MHTSVRHLHLFQIWTEEDHRFGSEFFNRYSDDKKTHADDCSCGECPDEISKHQEKIAHCTHDSDAQDAAGNGAEPHVHPLAIARPHQNRISSPASCRAVSSSLRGPFRALGIDTYAVESASMTPLRKRMVQIAHGELCADGHSSVSERIARCGSYYPEAGTRRDGSHCVRLRTYRCHQFGCPICEAEEAVVQAERMRKYLSLRLQEKPEEALAFVTLTQQKIALRNEDASGALDRIYRSWVGMTRPSRAKIAPEAIVASGYLLDGSTKMLWKITHDHNMRYQYHVKDGSWVSRFIDPLKTDAEIKEFLESQQLDTWWIVGEIHRVTEMMKRKKNIDIDDELWNEKKKKFRTVYRHISKDDPDEDGIYLDNRIEIKSSKKYIYPMEKDVLKAISDDGYFVYRKVDKNTGRIAWARWMFTQLICGGYRHVESTWSYRGMTRGDGSKVDFDGIHCHLHTAMELRQPAQWWLDEVVTISGESRMRLEWIRMGEKESGRYWVSKDGGISEYDPWIVFHEWRLFFDEILPILWRIFSPVHDSKDQFKAIDIQDLTEQSVYQISKYVLKPMDFDSDDDRELYSILVGRDIYRAMRRKKNNVPFGSWKNWKQEIDQAQESTSTSEDEESEEVEWGYRADKPLEQILLGDDDDEIVTFSKWKNGDEISIKMTFKECREKIFEFIIEQREKKPEDRSIPLLDESDLKSRKKKKYEKSKYEKRRDLYV